MRMRVYFACEWWLRLKMMKTTRRTVFIPLKSVDDIEYSYKNPQKKNTHRTQFVSSPNYVHFHDLLLNISALIMELCVWIRNKLKFILKVCANASHSYCCFFLVRPYVFEPMRFKWNRRKKCEKLARTVTLDNQSNGLHHPCTACKVVELMEWRVSNHFMVADFILPAASMSLSHLKCEWEKFSAKA